MLYLHSKDGNQNQDQKVYDRAKIKRKLKIIWVGIGRYLQLIQALKIIIMQPKQVGMESKYKTFETISKFFRPTKDYKIRKSKLVPLWV